MNIAIFVITVVCQPVIGTETHAAPIMASRVDIVGSGFNGTDSTGPIKLFVCPGDGFQLGRGDPFRATGGRLERMRIVRSGTGGVAINLTARSIAERPGQYTLRDLLILGMSDLKTTKTVDNWETGLRVDGGDDPELKKNNVAGLRCVYAENVRIAGCLGDSILLKNATHFTGSAIQVDPGSAKRVPAVVIQDSRHVLIDKMNIFGEVHVRGSNVIVLSGYAQTIYIDKACADINITGVVGKVVVERGAKRVMVNTVGTGK